ncbi:MAG: hypothetical protein ABSG37_02745 [Candidatus Limnocylindrales bacterium]|jgi:hypothetical protein
MRLNEWRKTAGPKELLNDRVLTVLGPVLTDLGAALDPECWVVWGDDPEVRYSVLAPTIAGLIIVTVRPTGSVDGPRATGKLVRWPKLSISELGVEASGGHRIVAVQVENIVLKGMDGEADRICEFVRELIAGVDDRNPTPVPIAVAGRGASGRLAGAATAGRVGARAARPARAAKGSGVAARKDIAVAPKPPSKPASKRAAREAREPAVAPTSRALAQVPQLAPPPATRTTLPK